MFLNVADHPTGRMLLNNKNMKTTFLLLMLGFASLAGCASGTVVYDSPIDEALELESPGAAHARSIAQQTVIESRRLVAEGMAQIARAREKIILSEKKLIEADKLTERAASTGSALMLDRAAGKIREANEVILVNQQEIAAAQRKIRDGRMQMNVAANMLRELDDELIRVPEKSR